MIPNRIVSLCTGVGGLEMAVREVYGGEIAAYAEIDPASIAVFERHNPGVPNLGDITGIDWAGSGAVDIVTAGFPCQDISEAGLRKGIEGARSGLYVHVVRAVRELRPRLVVIENVAAILRRGGVTVVRALAEAGYDAEWITVRASDAVGACHPRSRWFCVARLRDAPHVERQRARGPELAAESNATGNADRPPEAQGGRTRADTGRRGLLPTPLASDGEHGGPNARHSDGSWKLSAIGRLIPDAETWGEYAPAIARWQSVLGRPAPNPHAIGSRGGTRVSTPFVEWMMGFPAGWVTSTPLDSPSMTR